MSRCAATPRQDKNDGPQGGGQPRAARGSCRATEAELEAGRQSIVSLLTAALRERESIDGLHAAR